jgi:hypothetical protein
MVQIEPHCHYQMMNPINEADQEISLAPSGTETTAKPQPRGQIVLNIKRNALLQPPSIFAQTLCTSCQNIRQMLGGTMRTGFSADLPRARRALLSSLTDNHCGICQAIIFGLGESITKHNLYDMEFELSISFRRGVTLLLYSEKWFTEFRWMRMFAPSSKCLAHCLYDQPNLCEACPWQIFPSISLSDTEPLPVGSFNWVARRIESCLSSHRCGSIGESRLPTRIIDVGSGPDEVRLIQNSRCAGKYICLSHCWGTHQPLRTTTQNLLEHLVSLPWQSIPRTYQDAIRFTRFLGVRYLWIDSLCIVQDDPSDWARESASMYNIYEDSYLTIAATSAADATKGLFIQHERDSLVLDITGTTSAKIPFRVIGLESLWHPDFHIDLDRDLVLWPLLFRAWVFQERSLSPRVIHFNQYELIWECREERLCECGDRDGDLAEMGKRERIQDCPSDKLISKWHDLVESYSILNISFATDKLPALSGLAQLMAKRRPDAQYLAGLWSDSLEIDLLWLSKHGQDDAKYRYSSVWRAPSWSWAAIDAGAVFPDSQYYYSISEAPKSDLMQTYFFINSAHSIPATPDPTGQVKSASLTITGKLFPVNLFKALPSDSHWTLGVHGTGNTFKDEIFNDGNELNLDVRADPFHLGGHNKSPGGALYCVRMARVRRRYALSGSEVRETEYSLIVHSSSQDTSMYNRIGMATQQRKSRLPEDLEDPTRMWRSSPSFFEIGGARRTITIT